MTSICESASCKMYGQVLAIFNMILSLNFPSRFFSLNRYFALALLLSLFLLLSESLSFSRFFFFFLSHVLDANCARRFGRGIAKSAPNISMACEPRNSINYAFCQLFPILTCALHIFSIHIAVALQLILSLTCATTAAAAATASTHTDPNTFISKV